MDVEAFLREVIVELVDIDEGDITSDISLEDLGLASLDYVEVQVLVRKRFGVEISPELLTSGEVKTLAEFSDYIRNSAQAVGDSKAA